MSQPAPDPEALHGAERLRARLLLWRHFPRVLRLADRQRLRTILGIGAGMLSGLAGPGLTAAVIVLFVDRVLTQGDLGQMPLLAVLVGGLMLLLGGCGAIRTVLLARARAETSAALRLDLHGRVLRASLDEIERRKSAALHDRLLRDLESVMALLYGIGPGLIHSLALLVGAALVCFRMHAGLSLVGLALLPPFLIVAFLWVRRLRPRYKALQEQGSQLGATLQQHYAGARVIKGFARERWAVVQTGRQQKDIVAKTMELVRHQAVLGFCSAVVTGGGMVAVLWYGSRLAGRGEISSGELIAFYAALAFLTNSVTSLIGLANALQQSLASAERIFEIRDLPPEADTPAKGRRAHAAQSDLEIENLTFAYPTTDPTQPPRRILDDVSVRVPQGSIVALVGPSGAGKTTTAALVAQLLRPDSGAIRWAGQNITQFSLGAWRRSLAIVHQEDWLLAATVRENLLLGRRHITEADLWSALDLACARELVERLPQGLDTETGERGHGLSGGERQRLCLARAFLGRPRLLLLDEATAGLDLRSEATIFDNLRRLPGAPSVLLISHRLSAVSVADRIFFLDESRIAEEGTHEELIALGGMYTEAFMLQGKARARH